MTTPKTQNSILVLATLGVYLGLILAGATPQVLAQAAMTRQFDVTDEVEVKDDLDKKPNNEAAVDELSVNAETEEKLASAIEVFLTQFGPPTTTLSSETLGFSAGSRSTIPPTRPAIRVPIERLIAVTNFPRAGLHPLLANNAK